MMRRLAEAWDYAVRMTLRRDPAGSDRGADVADPQVCRQFYFLGALAALRCLRNGARPAALQDEADTADGNG